MSSLSLSLSAHEEETGEDGETVNTSCVWRSRMETVFSVFVVPVSFTD